MTERISVAEYRARQAKPAATPAAGVSASRPSTTKKPSATNSLTKAVVAMLTLEGCFAWRQNNGGVFDPTREVFRANSSVPGTSDVLGFEMRTCRLIAVEIKTGKDKLRPDQITFLDRIRQAGGFACEGRSLDQIRAEFIAWRRALPN